MNTQFTISQFRENIKAARIMLDNLKTLHGLEYRLSESSAIAIIERLGVHDFETVVANAKATSETTERRTRVDFRILGPLNKYPEYSYSGMSYNTLTSKDHEEVLEELQKRKLEYIIFRGYTSQINSYSINTSDTEIKFSTFIDTHREQDVANYETSYFNLLFGVLEPLETVFNEPIGRGEISFGRRRYDLLADGIKDRINYRKTQENETDQKVKDQQFVNILASKTVDRDTVEEQMIAAYTMLPSNGLVARTWGFEIEVPDAKNVDAPAGVEKGEDGSLRSYEGSNDCECDCEGCTYHDCDCDYCDSRREGDDHCDSSYCNTADSAEFRTTGGLQRIISPALYKLCKELNEADAEKNDSAGTHIHVYAKDLTTNQVGQVLATYKRLENLMYVINGRADVNYARNIPMEYIRAALKKRNPRVNTDKPRAVNIGHLTNNRGTIEFRQMDCNLDANRITLWAWICRAFVTSAKRGLTFKDAANVTDLNSLIEMFAKYNVLIHDENPEAIVYGSKTDAGSFELANHKTM